VVQGLKEALGKGVQQAVSQLGHDGGFLTNLNVKIPMPETMQHVFLVASLAGLLPYSKHPLNCGRANQRLRSALRPRNNREMRGIGKPDSPFPL